MIRALILDLDNTIYPVSSIAGHLFTNLFRLEQLTTELDAETLERVKEEFTRKPYQAVADKYQFSEKLKQAGRDLLKNLSYDLPMQAFEGYRQIRAIPLDKFLVTLGFTTLQYSKVKMLDIEDDFKEIHIVDPDNSTKTKQHVFQELMEKYGYQPNELLVIGDDPESEIKAATALGITTFLFDPNGKHINAIANHRSDKLEDVVEIVRGL